MKFMSFQLGGATLLSEDSAGYGSTVCLDKRELQSGINPLCAIQLYLRRSEGETQLTGSFRLESSCLLHPEIRIWQVGRGESGEGRGERGEREGRGERGRGERETTFAYGLAFHKNQYCSKLTEWTQHRSANLILLLKHFALRADYIITPGFPLQVLLLLLGAAGTSAMV